MSGKVKANYSVKVDFILLISVGHEIPEAHLGSAAGPHGFSGTEVPRVDYEKLSGDRVGETSESIRARVQAARDIQNKRFGVRPRSVPTLAQSHETLQSIVCSADMHVGEIRRFCKLQEEGQSLMRAAMTQLNLSARAYHRIPSAGSGQA